jgi:hypothetical protein
LRCRLLCCQLAYKTMEQNVKRDKAVLEKCLLTYAGESVPSPPIFANAWLMVSSIN